MTRNLLDEDNKKQKVLDEVSYGQEGVALSRSNEHDALTKKQ